MIKTYDVIFAVKIATFKELNDHDKGSLLRGFVEFMKSRGIEQDFLVSGTEIILKGKTNDSV